MTRRSTRISASQANQAAPSTPTAPATPTARPPRQESAIPTPVSTCRPENADRPPRRAVPFGITPLSNARPRRQRVPLSDAEVQAEQDLDLALAMAEPSLPRRPPRRVKAHTEDRLPLEWERKEDQLMTTPLDNAASGTRLVPDDLGDEEFVGEFVDLDTREDDAPSSPSRIPKRTKRNNGEDVTAPQPGRPKKRTKLGDKETDEAAED